MAANDDDARTRVGCISSRHLIAGQGNFRIINYTHFVEGCERQMTVFFPGDDCPPAAATDAETGEP